MVTLSLSPLSAWAQSSATLEALRAGRPEALDLARADLSACEKIEACPRAANLRLLVGQLAVSRGDPAAALEALSKPPPEKLSAHHAYYRGLAYLGLKDFARAAEAFDRAEKIAPASLLPRLRAPKARALFEAKKFEGVNALLEQSLGAESPELLYQRAVSRAELGQRAKARADLIALLVRAPSHPLAAEALVRLGKTASFTFEERLQRANRLLEADQPKPALLELDAAKALAKSAKARAQLALVRASACFADGREQDGQDQLELALRGPRAVAAEALHLRGRRLLRSGDNEGAKAALEELDRRFPKEAVTNEGAFFIGWIDLQAERYTEAAAAFANYMKSHPRSRKLDEAAWFRALALIRLPDLAAAKTALGDLVLRFPQSSLVPQALYWKARCDQLLGGTEPASVIEQYERVRNTFPASFYAALAGARLSELGKPAAALFPRPGELQPAPAPELALARELFETGLLEDAAAEVQTVMATIKGAPKALGMGAALQALGYFGEAHALATRSLWSAAYGKRQSDALALMYPRAFREAVTASAQQRSVDPSFVWAIMRRESAFRPQAHSAANARGLMQIIPPTAEAIAKALSLPSPAPSELFAPELNIKLAAWYLGALLERFGHPAIAAAAYNAGPPAVSRWLSKNGQLPLDLWVEQIPYKETRGYVKQVIADLEIYRALYAEGTPPALSLTIPSPRADGVTF